jgi:hypothetical protein
MLENIDKPIDLSEPEKKRWIAEVKFLKAFYHYYLIRMYGPVILIDKSFPIDAPTDSLKRKRSSTDESFAYVVAQLGCRRYPTCRFDRKPVKRVWPYHQVYRHVGKSRGIGHCCQPAV